MNRRLVTSLALAALLGSRGAFAQQRVTPAGTREAVSHFERGVALFDGADFAGALVEFKRAFAFSPHLDVVLQMHVTEGPDSSATKDAVLRIELTLQSVPRQPTPAVATVLAAADNPYDIDPSGGTKPHRDIDPTSPYGAP
ncbi:MAG TPA: hypothetical protein VF316_16920 [Polyangiaceae bacterium]